MIKESDYYKIIVAVPPDSADNIREAMNNAGASKQGNYDLVFGSHKAIGQWRPLKGAKPHIGKIDEISEMKEEVINCLCHKDKLKAVIEAIKQTHPYEEPGIDIIKRYEV